MRRPLCAVVGGAGPRRGAALIRERLPRSRLGTVPIRHCHQLADFGFKRKWVYTPWPVAKSVFTPKYERLRQRLIAARKASGLTQAELAVKLARPQSYVSKYERGERRLDVIEFLEVTQLLGMDPAARLQDLQHRERR